MCSLFITEHGVLSSQVMAAFSRVPPFVQSVPRPFFLDSAESATRHMYRQQMYIVRAYLTTQEPGLDTCCVFRGGGIFRL